LPQIETRRENPRNGSNEAKPHEKRKEKNKTDSRLSEKAAMAESK
jgi:hypothetical protein